MKGKKSASKMFLYSSNGLNRVAAPGIVKTNPEMDQLIEKRAVTRDWLKARKLETIYFQTPAQGTCMLYEKSGHGVVIESMEYVLHFILFSYPHLTSQFWLFLTASRGKIPQHLFWVLKSEYVLSSSILSFYGNIFWNPTEYDFYYCFLLLKISTGSYFSF